MQVNYLKYFFNFFGLFLLIVSTIHHFLKKKVPVNEKKVPVHGKKPREREKEPVNGQKLR
jgi:hypothetical protein